MALSALLALLIAAPAFAVQPAPASPVQEFVDPAILQVRADALRDAVGDMSNSDNKIHHQAHGLFSNVSESPLVVATNKHRRMDQEAVSGKMGSVEGMLGETVARIDKWKLDHNEPPPPDLEKAVSAAAALHDNKQVEYDGKGELEDSQAGVYKWILNLLTGGRVIFNTRMIIRGALLGNAFTTATFLHEAQHHLDHKAGRLSPDEVIAGEVSADRTVYLWLKLMDERGERMLTLHGRLSMWALREPDPEIKAALLDAVAYLEHLSDVVATNGEKEKLEKLAKERYSEGHKHGDGHNH